MLKDRSSARNPLEPLVRAAEFVGLYLMFGGLASLCAMWLFGPVPQAVEEWRMLAGQVRTIFFACVFAGLVLAIIAGVMLWRFRRTELSGARWFALKLAICAVALPALHLYGRTRMIAWRKVIDSERIAEAADRWNAVGMAFAIALVVMLGIALLSFIKPRLGQGQVMGNTAPLPPKVREPMPQSSGS